MKHSRANTLASCIFWVVLFVLASRFRLCAQPLEGAAGVSGMTPVTNRADLPSEGGTFWIFRGFGQDIAPIPCLPGDFPNAPIYFLGTNLNYLVDASDGQLGSLFSTNTTASSANDATQLTNTSSSSGEATYAPMDGGGGDGGGGSGGFEYGGS